MLIFVGFDLGGDKDEILFRKDQRAQSHSAQVVAKDLCLLLVLGNTKGSDGMLPAERRNDIGFVDTRNAECGGTGAGPYSVIQHLVLLRGADDMVKKMHKRL